jgi:tetratricopeptide (TPR) repeat protein
MIQRCFTLCAVFFLCSLCWARPSDRITFSSGEVTPIEQKFFADLDNGRLARFSKADAFLIASGITGPVEFESYRQRFDTIRRQAEEAVKGDRDDAARARALLIWLHANVFKKYKFDATTADRILDWGEFNCLGASVLYAVIADDLLIPVEGVLVPDHALCEVMTARGPVDVETGIRSGFDISDSGINELKLITGISYSRRSERRKVTILQLIGEVYANRVAQLARAVKDGAKFQSFYKKALYFDPSSGFFARNLIACFNNRAVDLLEARNYAAARDYIRQGRRFDPRNANFSALEIDCYMSMTDADASHGRYQDAVNRVKEALRAHPGDIRLRQSLVHLYVTWAHAFAAKDGYDTAIQILTAGRKDVPDDMTIPYNLNTAFYNKAVQCYNSKHYLDAVTTCDQALVSFPGDARIMQLRRSAAESAGPNP